MIIARSQRKEEDTSMQHNERGWDNADNVKYLQSTGVVTWKASINKAKPKRVGSLSLSASRTATRDPCHLVRSRTTRDTPKGKEQPLGISLIRRGIDFSESLEDIFRVDIRHAMKLRKGTSWLLRSPHLRRPGPGAQWVSGYRTAHIPPQLTPRRYHASVSAAELQFGQPLYETHPHLLKAGERKKSFTPF
jgi:hypothetical protein